MQPVDWKNVEEALSLVEKAIDALEFQKWIDLNRDDLDISYDDYKSSCYESLEEPNGYYMWALGRFLQETNEVETIIDKLSR